MVFRIKKSNFIMVFMILLLILPFSIAETPDQIRLKSYVNDYANILTDSEESSITSTLKSLHDSGIAEFSVVTINSLEGRDIESFSFEVAEGNLGDSEGNNGLLLLISIEDRKYRFEVGRGLEPYLNDAKVGRIAREFIVPNFQQGDYYNGILESVQSVDAVLRENVESKYYPKESKSYNIDYSAIWWVFFFIIIIIRSVINNRNRKKGKGKGKSDDDLFFAGLLAASMMRGGGRGGFGGGGFGGFGGGSFGGGGSSGGW